MTRHHWAIGCAVLGLLLWSAPSLACLDTTALKESILSQLHTVTACIETERKATPTLAGKLRLNFTISPSNAVTESKSTSGDDLPASLLDCANEATLQWRFPSVLGIAHVRYPVSLEPTGDSERQKGGSP